MSITAFNAKLSRTPSKPCCAIVLTYRAATNLYVSLCSPSLRYHHGTELQLCLQLMSVQRCTQLGPLDPRASETPLLKALFKHFSLISLKMESIVIVMC